MKDLSSDPVKTPFKMEAEIKGFKVSKGESTRVDMKESEVAVSAGKIMKTHLKAHVVDSGLKKLQTSGTMALDLAKAFPLLPSSVRTSIGAGSNVAGNIAVDWNYSGRRPTSTEIAGFTSKELSLKEKLLTTSFLKTVQITTRLTDIRLEIPFGKKGRFKVDKINTPDPLNVSFNSDQKQINFGGNFSIKGISDLPLPIKIGKPVQGVLSFTGTLNNMEALTFSQDLKIETLGLNQSLKVSLGGIDKFLSRTGQPLPTEALKKLRGTLEASIKADFRPELVSYIQALSTEGLDMAGAVEAAGGVDFDGNGEITGRLQIKSPHMDMGLKDRLNIKGLKIDLDLKKKLRIVSGKETGRTGAAKSPYLSAKVLNPLLSAKVKHGSRSRFSSDHFPMGDLRVPFADRPTLAFDSLHMKMDPFPLDLTDFALRFHLEDSLPSIDSFQFDVLGGTSVGSVFITRKGNGTKDLFMVEMNGSFTGIDAARIAPRDAGTGLQGVGAPAGETELSGNISIRLPVSGNPDAAINNLSGVIRLTHIGSKTLERILYSMDPYESNEMIRKQRTLLRQGTPLWITVEIRSGNLSLSGEMLVKGARIPLPTLQRFNITALPIRKKLKKAFSSLHPVVDALKAASANAILMNKGKIELVTP